MATIPAQQGRRARRRVTALRSLAAAALLFTARAEAQSTPILRGVVRDSSAGVFLRSAEVRVEGGAQRVLTGDQGEFHLPVPAQGARLIVRRLGFRPETVSVRSSSEVLQIVLRPTAQRLARVVVNASHDRYTGRLAGYYQRLERGTQGQFITRADLDREKPPQLTDMLQRQPGVHMSRGRPGPARLQMRGRECVPLVWLDGVSLSGGDVDLDAFAPTTLEGIELYLGASVPSRYAGVRGQSECGVVLLWSRGPDTEPKHLGRSVTPEELEDLIASATIYTAEQVDSVARLDQSHPPEIEYPPSLRAEHIEGTVLAEFVVDTLGRVEPDRFGIVGSTDPLFSDAVRSAIRGASYTPAIRGGRRVRQLVRQPFVFRLPAGGS
jgi:TonB family protein